MPPDREIYDLFYMINFHQNHDVIQRSAIKTASKDAMGYGGNGGKEVNMKQSTLDFWSEFHLKVEHLHQLSEVAWENRTQNYRDIHGRR